MISASQAKELVEQSDKVINQLLERIGPEIEREAKAGGRELSLTGRFSGEIFTFKYNPYSAPTWTPEQKRLVDELTKHGYTCSIKSYTYDANKSFKSMADPNDPPNMQTGYSFMVRW